MTAIIIEGPDESGKTTLATALLGYFGDDAAYVKSPAGRSPEWYHYFDSWVGKVMEDTRKPLWIFDRCPEISELVYGPVMRGFSRLNNPIASILGMPKGSVAIFCEFPSFPKGLKGYHEAVGGHPVSPSKQRELIGGYKIATTLVHEVMTVLPWRYWESDRIWDILLSQLPFTTDRTITFDEALEEGEELIQ